ncbi:MULTISPECIES: hypothetical protein [unclassified Sulfitobacter]|jgi:hypothetical protein|uniref:hypothetical protein n=1 Tax=unclassified Sulfitobacter TaxID=196795 RepID=UPI0007C34E4F|nr:MULTISPECIES: hypothetical protein [unclassified Sulfitobacter]KZX96357.1 hypothetical protein A3720_20215 [Sulfitobacter sp. HI0021]KZY04208.1 hypothetical protein A3722_19465 [Sulfitobacter sp. HI0027]KZZ03073.1 hypothetical protein A3747_13255 [Sulfitobacter sp. HI0076]
MFGLSRTATKLIIVAALFVAAVLLVVWLRYDSARDREGELRGQHNEDRIGHIEDAKGAQNEIEGLTDDDLDSALCRVLSTPEQCEQRRAIQGREPAATEGATSDD